MSEKKQEKNNKNNIIIYVMGAAIIILLLLLLLNQCSGAKKNDNGGGGNTPTPTPTVDESQGAYVKPETPIDRSKNVTLPGWGSFTIPANTKTIDKGFEFHNPAENMWYEVAVKYNNQTLEKLIVDSGNIATAEHYAKLANIKGTNYKFKSVDTTCFELVDKDGIECIKAIAPFEGEKDIVIEVDGQDYTFKASCDVEIYYMTFALYLDDGTENGELLYQSGLVKPGNYIQTMELSRALQAGDYDAYVFIQPYRSDQVSKTNTGKVVIDLIVR
jgi:hypothetical protein